MAMAAAAAVGEASSGSLRTAPFSVAFDLTAADAVTASRTALLHDSVLRHHAAWGLPLAISVALLVAFAQSFMGDAGSGAWNAAWFWTAAGVSISGIALVVLVAGWVWPLTLHTGPLQHGQYPQLRVVELDERSVLQRTGHDEIRLSWHAVDEVLETTAGLFLRSGSAFPVYIPRRVVQQLNLWETAVQKIRVFQQAARLAPSEAENGLDAAELVGLPENALVADYELTPEDQSSFLRHHLIHRGVLTTCLVILACAALGWWGLNGGLRGGVLGLAAALLTCLALLPRLLIRSWQSQPGVLGRRVLAITPTGLVGANEVAPGGVVRWEQIQRAELGRDHLFLYYAGHAAVTVPFRAFQQVGDPYPSELLELVNQWRTTRIRP